MLSYLREKGHPTASPCGGGGWRAQGTPASPLDRPIWGHWHNTALKSQLLSSHLDFLVGRPALYSDGGHLQTGRIPTWTQAGLWSLCVPTEDGKLANNQGKCSPSQDGCVRGKTLSCTKEPMVGWANSLPSHGALGSFCQTVHVPRSFLGMGEWGPYKSQTSSLEAPRALSPQGPQPVARRTPGASRTCQYYTEDQAGQHCSPTQAFCSAVPATPRHGPASTFPSPF